MDSRPVIMRLWVKSPRMAASMRGVVRRVRSGWWWLTFDGGEDGWVFRLEGDSVEDMDVLLESNEVLESGIEMEFLLDVDVP